MTKKTVEDIVLEIKDKSELMVDLAYSSLLYDNKIIAKEVYDLEDQIDGLYQNIQMITLENVKNNIRYSYVIERFLCFHVDQYISFPLQ